MNTTIVSFFFFLPLVLVSLALGWFCLLWRFCFWLELIIGPLILDLIIGWTAPFPTSSGGLTWLQHPQTFASGALRASHWFGSADNAFTCDRTCHWSIYTHCSSTNTSGSRDLCWSPWCRTVPIVHHDTEAWLIFFSTLRQCSTIMAVPKHALLCCGRELYCCREKRVFLFTG